MSRSGTRIAISVLSQIDNHAVSFVLKEEFFKYEMILKCYDHVCRRENNDRVDLTRFKTIIEPTIRSNFPELVQIYK